MFVLAVFVHGQTTVSSIIAEIDRRHLDTQNGTRKKVNDIFTTFVSISLSLSISFRKVLDYVELTYRDSAFSVGSVHADVTLVLQVSAVEKPTDGSVRDRFGSAGQVYQVIIPRPSLSHGSQSKRWRELNRDVTIFGIISTWIDNGDNNMMSLSLSSKALENGSWSPRAKSR